MTKHLITFCGTSLFPPKKWKNYYKINGNNMLLVRRKITNKFSKGNLLFCTLREWRQINRKQGVTNRTTYVVVCISVLVFCIFFLWISTVFRFFFFLFLKLKSMYIIEMNKKEGMKKQIICRNHIALSFTLPSLVVSFFTFFLKQPSKNNEEVYGVCLFVCNMLSIHLKPQPLYICSGSWWDYKSIWRCPHVCLLKAP